MEALPITVEGVLQTEEGAPVRFTWDMTRDNTWTAGIELDTDVLAATHNGKGTMYVTSGDGKTMRSVDMETGVSAKLSTWANGLDDLAYSKLFSTQEQDPGLRLQFQAVVSSLTKGVIALCGKKCYNGPIQNIRGDSCGCGH